MTITAWKKSARSYGPGAAGLLMTPREFDRSDFLEGWRYELINGVLVVSSTPSLNERDPNQALGRWLLNYQEEHPQGSALDFTIHEHTIVTGSNRRRADRVLWTGLGRLPRRNEIPSVVMEFVSAGKRNLFRDYELKRDEYLASGVQEYWVIDRFQRTLTVFTRQGRKTRKQVFHEDQVYTTNLLPGFELPLARLFALANRWAEEA